MYKVDLQHWLRTYAPKEGDRIPVHLVLVPCVSGVTYIVRCCGSVSATNVEVEGMVFPVLLKNELPLRQANDHALGCDKLNWNVDQTVVKNFITKFSKVVDKIFHEPRLEITLDTTEKENIREGYIPVKIKGTASSGPVFKEETKAILVTGNCV